MTNDADDLTTHKHFYTKKYANLLFFQKPLLYFKLQKIKKNTAEWRSLFAMYAAKRIERN